MGNEWASSSVFNGRARMPIENLSSPSISTQSPSTSVVMALKHPHHYFFESGGHLDSATTIGFPPLCTVGAAELEPPALGRIALFPIAIDVLSSALADVPDREIVQLTSGLPLDEAVDWAARGTAAEQPNKAATAMRGIFLFIPWHPSLCTKRTSCQCHRSVLGNICAGRPPDEKL